MVAPRKRPKHISTHINTTFTDQIHFLVAQEARRLRNTEGITLQEAADIAAFFALIPITAIVSGGNKQIGDKAVKMCEQFINSFKELD